MHYAIVNINRQDSKKNYYAYPFSDKGWYILSESYDDQFRKDQPLKIPRWEFKGHITYALKYYKLDWDIDIPIEVIAPDAPHVIYDPSHLSEGNHFIVIARNIDQAKEVTADLNRRYGDLHVITAGLESSGYGLGAFTGHVPRPLPRKKRSGYYFIQTRYLVSRRKIGKIIPKDQKRDPNLYGFDEAVLQLALRYVNQGIRKHSRSQQVYA